MVGHLLGFLLKGSSFSIQSGPQQREWHALSLSIANPLGGEGGQLKKWIELNWIKHSNVHTLIIHFNIKCSNGIDEET